MTIILCDDCILEAHKILQDILFRDKLKEEIIKLQEKKGWRWINEHDLTEKYIEYPEHIVK